MKLKLINGLTCEIFKFTDIFKLKCFTVYTNCYYCYVLGCGGKTEEPHSHEKKMKNPEQSSKDSKAMRQ